MEIPREQFDELLGGKEQLPHAVSLLKFVEARSQEITALREAVDEPQNKHLVFQRMPRHLRRRAMSHNVKRMPRRLQEAHLSQMVKSGLPTKSKRPSRKYRRRPSNLLQEYNRRQRTNKWLETHIWHAKRFHMTQLWGYKLADFPNDKSFRACYRATAQHCLIQDVSYLNCIELKGAESNILQCLSNLTNPEIGPTFAAKSTLNGLREGSVVVYRKGYYPFKAIGKVTFMWRPETHDNRRTVWIWSYPAFYNELLEELISVFGFRPENFEHELMETDTANDVVNDRIVKRNSLVNINVKEKKLKLYSNGNIEMTLLNDTLNRFRLTGPLSQATLTEALKFVNIENFINNETSKEVEEEHRSVWLQKHYSSNERVKNLREQCLFWENKLPNVNLADELPPKMILSAVVMDPRHSMPTSRIKAVNSRVCSLQPELRKGLSDDSALWDSKCRDQVSCSKMANSELNRLRSNALVPGLATPTWLCHQHVSHLPLLLVQRPSSRISGFGSGWDVIAPAEWGMPLWLGLVWRGARAGGLRETNHLTLETQSGPVLPPDTMAGQALSEQLRAHHHLKHFRLPPKKRPNYVKLGVVSPFYCPWEQLVQDWYPSKKDEDGGFYVIRNRMKIEVMQSIINENKPANLSELSERDKSFGIVQVSIEMCGRGTVQKFAMICLPGKKDLKMAKEKSARGLMEPLHEDNNEQERKSLRTAHIAKLKKLRKKRARTKRTLEEQGIFAVKEGKKVSPTEELVNDQSELMERLWLPSDIQTVKNSTSRCVMGFVTCGDFSFTQSKCIGYGFVALTALISLMEMNQNYVLVRNVTSLQYHLAQLKVLPVV